MITIEELKNYRYLQMQAQAIQEQIRQMYVPISSPQLSQIGTKSNVPGDPTRQAFYKIERLNRELEDKVNEIAVQMKRILDWVDTIDNPEIQIIIRWHFMNGLSWKETARKIYSTSDSDSCRMKFYRYFNQKDKSVR
ncbi:MAG: hypothetical protein HXL56_01160 [Solobacterium sp.]|jgi:hypothetical protein|uniref:Uncharacterized protein n=1 Tax=Siphoviridae sp. ctNYt19 TaxID=2825472 RepID=A0A8S5QIU2_9CAUD|nr:hypothetical protein [Solobacterium sp.]DAE19214.1 MAG TPA: Protein of unknown function (DUF722) [Siphoviridae sp. ctNYt19]DAN19006.1 MAG TPA: Protein of unknown function (DUF722) [Caudoviricetes sp.]DAS76849.1 MAG TPA: Protein of unknown function (DUF722) [Caudoviricetes sp.]